MVARQLDATGVEQRSRPICSYPSVASLKEGKNPRPECTGDAYMGADELPLNMRDALDTMMACQPMRDALGNEFCLVYESVKRNEYKEFLQVISPWEREHLLQNV